MDESPLRTEVLRELLALQTELLTARVKIGQLIAAGDHAGADSLKAETAVLRVKCTDLTEQYKLLQPLASTRKGA